MERKEMKRVMMKIMISNYEACEKPLEWRHTQFVFSESDVLDNPSLSNR
jgi:hypothetical protein